MPATIELHGLYFSPWTHRARWALDLSGVPYSYREYLPGLSEPGLRLRLGKLGGTISAPVLLHEGGASEGSAAIARFAAARGAALGDLALAEPWEALADAAQCEGRERVIAASLASPEVQFEATAGVVPEWLRGRSLWATRMTLRRLDRKYGALVVPGSMRAALLRTRAQLGSGRYLLGHFSYADVVMASMLEMVAPLAQRGEHTTRAWSWPELAQEFADIVAWRNALMERHWPVLLRARASRLHEAGVGATRAQPA